jgi:ornithine carbamoyltransferase
MTDHYLTLDSLGREGVREILDLSHRFKREPGRHREALAGGIVGMIFDKPSTRTRVSLENAAWALGMHPIVMRPDELQLGHGETVADTARVLSRYLSALTIRTFAHPGRRAGRLDPDHQRSPRAPSVPASSTS